MCSFTSTCFIFPVNEYKNEFVLFSSPFFLHLELLCGRNCRKEKRDTNFFNVEVDRGLLAVPGVRSCLLFCAGSAKKGERVEVESCCWLLFSVVGNSGGVRGWRKGERKT